MLQEILAKESLNEDDLKFVSNHREQLTDKDLVRLGFKVEVSQHESATNKEASPAEDVAPKTQGRKKKVV